LSLIYGGALALGSVEERALAYQRATGVASFIGPGTHGYAAWVRSLGTQASCLPVIGTQASCLPVIIDPSIQFQDEPEGGSVKTSQMRRWISVKVKIGHKQGRD
jgi:hypothetical protein